MTESKFKSTFRRVSFPELSFYIYVESQMPEKYERHLYRAYMEGVSSGRKSVQDPIIRALGLSEKYKELTEYD